MQVAAKRMSSLVLPNVGLMDHVSPLPAFIHGKEEDEEVVIRKRNGFGFEENESSESSSIGAASSSSSGHRDEEEVEEVQSKRRDGALGSLDSLEDSLPVKRGLSNFFSGKSKSFASLSEVAMAGSSAKDIAKKENPFNKRRRLVMMSKMRRASYSSLLCPPLPPLLSASHTVEEADEEGGEEEEDRHAGSSMAPPFPLHGSDNVIKKKPFRSPRSLSLSDLQHV